MPMLVNPALSGNLGFADAGVVAVLGYAVVFFGLILLMLVIMILGAAFTAKEKRASAKAAAAAPVEEVVEAPKPVAPGAAGELKLHDVEPKTAALLMAIVADKMQKPINELRFISIKEVK